MPRFKYTVRIEAYWRDGEPVYWHTLVDARSAAHAKEMISAWGLHPGARVVSVYPREF